MLLAAVLALQLTPVDPNVPNRQLQLAEGNGTVVMAFGGGESIWLARSTENGRTFAAQSRIADLPKLHGAILAAWEEDGAIATRRVE